MKPAGALVEILNEDGTMSRLPQLVVKAEKFGLKMISINDLVEYRLRSERLVTIEKSLNKKIRGVDFKLIQYRQLNNGDLHVAFVKGEMDSSKVALVRVQHADTFSELIDNIVNDGNSILSRSIDILKDSDCGILILLTQTSRDSDPFNKIENKVQQESNKAEQIQREIGIGAQILHDLGVHKMKIISNNPRKTIALQGYGLEIIGYHPF
jgi:3,4-dihydroxy 2-butanone 4-phosphate synthase/GTP cyclohydrolase II